MIETIFEGRTVRYLDDIEAAEWLTRNVRRTTVEDLWRLVRDMKIRTSSIINGVRGEDVDGYALDELERYKREGAPRQKTQAEIDAEYKAKCDLELEELAARQKAERAAARSRTQAVKA